MQMEHDVGRYCQQVSLRHFDAFLFSTPFTHPLVFDFPKLFRRDEMWSSGRNVEVIIPCAAAVVSGGSNCCLSTMAMKALVELMVWRSGLGDVRKEPTPQTLLRRRV
jgi:hypothetical protein